MKNLLFVLMLVSSLALVGCTQQPAAPTDTPTEGEQPTPAETMPTVSEEEQSEFDAIRAVETPEHFPSELIYPTAKLIKAKRGSNPAQLSFTSTQKTTASQADILEYYNNTVADGDWKITGTRDLESGEQTIYTSNSVTGASVTIGIYENDFSKLRQISINYYAPLPQ